MDTAGLARQQEHADRGPGVPDKEAGVRLNLTQQSVVACVTYDIHCLTNTKFSLSVFLND